MSDQPIKDNPSLKKIRKDAESFSAFKKAWPFLRPFFRLLGADVKKIDEALQQGDDLVTKSEELTTIPDDFNDLFADKGWIMYDRINMDVAKKAIELGKSGRFDEAENVLVQYYSPEQIEFELKT